MKVASFYPFNFRVGDHRIILVDINKQSLIGSNNISSLSMPIQWLISSNSGAVESYLACAKDKIFDHKILLKLNLLIDSWDTFNLT